MQTSDAKKLTVGSLFAGIGGFDLAAERAGLEVKWQVEIDDYATRVLEKHWPDAGRYRDVRSVHARDWTSGPCRYDEDFECPDCLEPVDVLCGGFPCQPHSTAGRRLGAADERDLWPQFKRIIRELKPRWVVAENVTGLLSNDAGRFFGDVLRDLAEIGYDAEWDCIPASAIGAPHQRDRIWIVAYPSRIQQGRQDKRPERERTGMGRESFDVADDSQLGRRSRGARGSHPGSQGQSEQPLQAVADADSDQQRRRACDEQVGRIWIEGQAPNYGDAGGTQWAVEPAVGRVAHGVPDRVDRLRGLGNAIVPAVAEWIFRRIVEAEQA